MISTLLLLLFLFVIIINIEGYGPNSDVVSATDKTFVSEVLKHPGIVIGKCHLHFS
jgi:hypothetical protein